MKKFFNKIFNFSKKYITMIIIVFIFLFLYICDNSSLKVGNVIIDNLKSIATSFTPTTDLFDDGSEVSFVSYFFGMNITTKDKEEKIDFYYPNEKQNLSTTKDKLVYNFDGIVYSIAKGIVSYVGFTENGEKYIDILHPNGLISRYIGVENIGVSLNEIVLPQSAIGIAQTKKNITILLIKDNAKINIDEVDWKIRA